MTSIEKIVVGSLLAASTAAAQSYTFDNTGNATLKGPYFVREIVLQNLNPQGAVGEALSVIGTATFDGAGNYAFTGQLADSTASAGARTYTAGGTYAVAANGFLRMASFASKGSVAFGGVGAAGPAAFTASATENSSQAFDLIVGIPIGSVVSNATLTGAYNAVYLGFPQGAIGKTRQAYALLTADGAGGFGAVTATGSATDSASLTTQGIPSVTYSLSATGGSINFGSADASQLIGGTQSFFVSADGNLLVGGSPGGYDLLLASPALSSGSNAAFQRFYYLGGLDADNSVWNSQGESLPDAWYGSLNSTGQGAYVIHQRLNTNGYSVEDLTSGWHANVQPNGSFTPGDGAQYWLSAGGKVVLSSGLGNFYSIMAGLQAVNYLPTYPSTDVFLNPLGIVNAASFAPATNPVAPQEMLTLFGSNLASGTAQASAYPLPTALGNTRVLVNGIAAPLLAVSPTQVTILLPSHASPDFTAYAAFEVQNGGAVCPSPAPPGSLCPTSNMVTMYTNYTAPGVFSLGQNGLGPAAAMGAGNQVIGTSNPAKPGDMAVLFLTGMGAVAPPLPDGAPSSPTSQPLNFLDIYNGSGLSISFDAHASMNVPFAGVAPGYPAGLYQINAQIPAGVSIGNDYVDILTRDAEAEQVTLKLAGASSSAVGGARRQLVPRLLRLRRRAGPDSGGALVIRPAAPLSR
ncbi:MAG TPA: hypothetical protein VGN17_08570 [Bryobacteraceae bacterium]|jgi:uncharacterized protein (TIGR03437 family)